MSSIVMIIAQSQFRDEELFETKKTLMMNNHSVVIASRTLEPCEGNQGGAAQPDLTISDIDPFEYDALIFVGGGGAAEYFDDEKIIRLISQFDRKKKIIGAICIAPIILAGAGILRGKRATVFPSGKDKIIELGAIYTGEPVTIDGRIVTANGPASSVLFGEAILGLLDD